MSLNESIVEDAALDWCGVRGGRRVKSEIGRVKFPEVVPISPFTLHSFSCETIRRLNLGLSREAGAGIRKSGGLN
jgi:hypothetical protein